MLDRARDATGDVELRADRLAGLPDLVAVWTPAGIDGRSRRAHGRTECLGEFLEDPEILWTLHSPSAGDDDLRLGQIGGHVLFFFHLRYPGSSSLRYLIEQTNVDLVLFRENPVAIEMPITVELEVTETVPGFKGDTAQGGTKPATLETGLVVNVPMFVAQGEKIKVDTRTGNYLSRA